jgi:hypothetical protein
MSRKFRTDFYTVHDVQGGPLAAADIFRAIERRKNDDTRNVDYQKQVLRVHRIASGRGRWAGDAVKIRMNMHPVKASIRGPSGPFDLEDHEGVGEETAFLYDVATNVLAFQRNRIGVTANAFAWYLEQIGQVDRVLLDPVLRRDGIERLDRLDQISVFDVRFAGVTNPAAIRRPGTGTGEFASLLRRYGAPNASVRLSIGRQRVGSLSVADVVAAAKSLLRIGGDRHEVTKIEVSGYSEEDGKDMFDLLHLRMQGFEDVPDTQDRVLPYDFRRQAVSAAFEKHRTEIEEMFGRAT